MVLQSVDKSSVRFYLLFFIKTILMWPWFYRGATYSNLVLYNGNGEKLVQVAGPGTNHWVC